MADTFTPEQIAQILEEFFNVVGTRQYIGARYVPIFGRKDETSIEWDNTAPYEPLTIVLYQGNSYTSRQYVPVGVEITNQEFWAITGNYNAQIEQYRRETAAVRGIAESAQESANAAQTDIDTLLPKAGFSADNTVKKYVDDSIAQVADILPSEDFSETNTVKKYVDDSFVKFSDSDTFILQGELVKRGNLPEGYTYQGSCVYLNYLYVCGYIGSGNATIYKFDLDTLQLVGTCALEYVQHGNSLNVIPNTNYLVVCNTASANNLTVIDVSTMQEIKTYSTTGDGVHSFCPLANNTAIARIGNTDTFMSYYHDYRDAKEVYIGIGTFSGKGGGYSARQDAFPINDYEVGFLKSKIYPEDVYAKNIIDVYHCYGGHHYSILLPESEYELEGVSLVGKIAYITDLNGNVFTLDFTDILAYPVDTQVNIINGDISYSWFSPNTAQMQEFGGLITVNNVSFKRFIYVPVAQTGQREYATRINAQNYINLYSMNRVGNALFGSGHAYQGANDLYHIYMTYNQTTDHPDLLFLSRITVIDKNGTATSETFTEGEETSSVETKLTTLVNVANGLFSGEVGPESSGNYYGSRIYTLLLT